MCNLLTLYLHTMWRIFIAYFFMLCFNKICWCLNDENIHIDLPYRFGEVHNIKLNNSVEYIFQCEGPEECDDDFPAKVTVWCEDALISNPIFITARQQTGVLSWQLPLVVNNQPMRNVSRTLCPTHNIILNEQDIIPYGVQSAPIIHIYTSIKYNVRVQLRIDQVLDFSLGFNARRKMSVSPAKPAVYFYSFLSGMSEVEQENEEIKDLTSNSYFERQKKKFKDFSSRVIQNIAPDGTKSTVLVHVTSNDDTCMLMSIQNASCPIFDTERELTYEGFYATISKQGGISVTKKNYPYGFYIVLVVRSNDKECTGQNEKNNTSFFDWNLRQFDGVDNLFISNKQTREKMITIKIMGSVTYNEYVVGVVVLSMVVVAIYLMTLVFLIIFHRKALPLTVSAADVCQSERRDTTESYDIRRNQHHNHSTLDVMTTNYGMRSRDADSVDGQLEPLEQIYLDELCTQDTKSIKKQSNMYLWHLLTVAVFYGLPVVQLVIIYQRVLNQTGNQDQCYYNFLCAHPLGFFSDFNHIYSNTGYILLGILFIIIVWMRKKMHKDSQFDANFGIPQHYGLYYAMGGGLIMEGILSASYHICPNHMNFQFDTSFMYVIAVLCMIKIYQSRHPDVNASAHGTFGVLAGTVVVGLIGVLFPNFYFWLFFTVVHVMTCLILSLQVYYMGRLKINCACCNQCLCGGICRPAFRSRCLMVVLGNICNWSLAGFGLYHHSKDFASHLLYLFLMNLALYLFWYLIMKLINKEYLLWYCWILFFVACVTWGGALYFFFDKSTSWSLTPAQSRVYNKHCALMNFYDNHDIWHMLSAGAMFFSFLLFLTMDDDISHVPRDKIPVF